MEIDTTYDWGRFTPVDSTGLARPPYRSKFKNLRYRLQYWRSFVIRQGDIAGLPLIADRFYGDVSFWEHIMSYNGIVDPLTEVYVGRTLRLFTKSSFIKYINEQRNRPRPLTI